MNEWIKAFERLPEHSGPYLVYTLDNDRMGPGVVLAYYIGRAKTNDWSQVADATIGEVTHWMELPKDPE